MMIHRYLKSHALETVRDGLLKVSRLSDFNDPFEGMFSMPEKISAKEVRQYVRAGKDNTLVAFSPRLVGKEYCEAEIIYGIKQRYPEIRKERLKDWSHDRGNYVLVASFSNTSKMDPKDEILMWSHYTDCHRGVRIGFEINPTKTPRYSLKNVDYKADRITIRLGDSDDMNTELLWKAHTRKSEAWKYEEELRLLVRPEKCDPPKLDGDKTLFFFRYPQEWVRSIDFGTECPSTVIDPIIDFVRTSQRPIQLRKARYHESEFALVYDEIKV